MMVMLMVVVVVVGILWIPDSFCPPLNAVWEPKPQLPTLFEVRKPS